MAGWASGSRSRLRSLCCRRAHGGPTTSISEYGDLGTYRRSVSPDYANAADAAAFLDLNAPPGSIYVFGDPTIHLLSGRLQAIPVQGSAWDFYLPSYWKQLPKDLAAARPVWIFVESDASVARNSPATIALLARDYRVVWDTPYGKWYALNSTNSAPGAGL